MSDNTEVTLPEAAVHLKVAWYTAHRLALRGALGPVRQIAGRWLVTESGVAAYIIQRAVKALAAVEGGRRKEVPHGTSNGYTNYRCRCEPCKSAGSEANRKRRAAGAV